MNAPMHVGSAYASKILKQLQIYAKLSFFGKLTIESM